MPNNYCGEWTGKGNELVITVPTGEHATPKTYCEKVCVKMTITQKCKCPELYVVELKYPKRPRPDETIAMFRNGDQLQGEHASAKGFVVIKFNRNCATLLYSVATPTVAFEPCDPDETVVSVSGNVGMKKCERKCERKCECECERKCECECEYKPSCERESTCDCESESRRTCDESTCA